MEVTYPPMTKTKMGRRLLLGAVVAAVAIAGFMFGRLWERAAMPPRSVIAAQGFEELGIALDGFNVEDDDALNKLAHDWYVLYRDDQFVVDEWEFRIERDQEEIDAPDVVLVRETSGGTGPDFPEGLVRVRLVGRPLSFVGRLRRQFTAGTEA